MSKWYGMWAPAGTPPEAVKLLSPRVQLTLRSVELQGRLKGLGFVVATDTTDALAAVQRAKQKTWGEVVCRAGVRAK